MHHFASLWAMVHRADAAVEVHDVDCLFQACLSMLAHRETVEISADAAGRTDGGMVEEGHQGALGTPGRRNLAGDRSYCDGARRYNFGC